MKIRPYQSSDEKSVVQLWIDCALVVPHNNPYQDIARKLKVNPEWFLVGELDGKVIATCMAGYDGHRGWIYYLAVSPSLQGRCYAKAIMQKAEDLLTAAGCPKINLQIRTTNQQVIDFYTAIGFKSDAVVSMGKRLDPDEPYLTEPDASADADRPHR